MKNLIVKILEILTMTVMTLMTIFVVVVFLTGFALISVFTLPVRIVKAMVATWKE